MDATAERKTILLVEDEAIIAMAEARQLEKEGYRVLHAPSGERAVDLALGPETAVDLILMDIDLGRSMSGTEAARRIIESRDIPVLFLSSHMEKDVVDSTERISSYGYVVKNSSFTVLAASIKMAFRLFEAQKAVALKSEQVAAANEKLLASLAALQEANAGLVVSEEKFAKAFMHHPDSININRLSDGVYIDINEGFTRITGYTREDVIGRSSLPGDLGIWVRAEDRQRLVASLREKGSCDGLEADFRRKDGAVLPGVMAARIIEIDGEKCIISMTRDLSADKRIWRELRQAEARFRASFHNAPVGISLVGRDGRLLMVNAAFCSLLGKGEDELVGTDFRELTHPDDLEASLENARALASGESDALRFAKRYLRADGGAVWIDACVSVVRDAEGNPDTFIVHALERAPAASLV